MIARTGGPAWRRDMTSRIWSAGHVFYRRQADGDFLESLYPESYPWRILPGTQWSLVPSTSRMG